MIGRNKSCNNNVVWYWEFCLTLYFYCYSELKKLSEESLTRQPEEVFDIICKLGEGSYGSVYKVTVTMTRSLYVCLVGRNENARDLVMWYTTGAKLTYTNTRIRKKTCTKHSELQSWVLLGTGETGLLASYSSTEKIISSIFQLSISKIISLTLQKITTNNIYRKIIPLSQRVCDADIISLSLL